MTSFRDRPERGPSPAGGPGERRLALGFALALVLFTGVIVIGLFEAAGFTSGEAWVAHTIEVLGRIDGLRLSVRAAESDLRGYLLTGQARFLESQAAAAGEILPRWDQLRRLVADNPRQQTRLERLGPLLTAKVALMRDQAASLRPGAPDAAGPPPGGVAERGPQLTDQILAVCAEMTAEEEALRRQRAAARQRYLTRATTALGLVSAGGVGLLAVTYGLTRRELAVRRQAGLRFQELNAVLEREVAERRRAQESGQESQARFDAFMRHAPVLAWMKDERLRFVYVNPALAQRFDRPPEEILGCTDDDLHPEPGVAAGLRAADETVLRTGEAWQGTEHAPTPDGRSQEWQVYKFPFVSAHGRRFSGGMALDVTERQRERDRLAASLAEKEVLLREIHHRVKNNLQIVSGLLQLQAAKVTDPRALALFRDSQHRVRSMALIHEFLYASGDLSRVDCAPYLGRLTQALLRSYGMERQVTLRCAAEGVSLPLEQALPCGLLVNEMVSNALKYAFPDGRPGRIAVTLGPGAVGGDGRGGADTGVDAGTGTGAGPAAGTRPGYVLRVADDGVGLSSASTGPPAGGGGFGLRLIENLVDQLGADSRWEREGGTALTVRFAAAPAPGGPTAAGGG